MKATRFTLFIVFALFSTMVLAQKGKIRGTIIDGANGEPMYGVTVVIQGTTNGAATDFDGAFEINADAGTYNLQASFISYKTITISGVEVKAGGVTVMDNITLMEDIGQLEEVVVTAQAIKTTESALLTIKKKSPNLLDGISSQTFKRSGDSDAAAAIKRVPGVSTQGGKYVIVRGLGDRYTKSVLNNVDIPGLDPDRNTLQMDIFPTNLINNIVVIKSFTADLSADFTGGVVNIETKDFPEEKTFGISGSLGVNPSMHFNSNYIDYAGSGTDALGFDNGQRDLPLSSSESIPSPVTGDPRLTTITQSFDPVLGAEKKTSLPNMNLSLSAGNQVAGNKLTFGYNAAVSYRNNTTFYDDARNNLFVKPDQSNEFELRSDRTIVGSLGTNNVILAGMLGGAVKTDKSKLKINVLHIQNGESRAGLLRQTNFIRASNASVRDNLEYSERSITNVLVAGEHLIEGPQIEVDWKLAPTFSSINDKDVRVTPFTDNEGVLSIEPSEGGDPTRIWRFLDEKNYAAKLDLTKKYVVAGRDAKLKFGASNTYKERDFDIQNFRINLRREDQLTINGDANAILAPENIWTPATGAGSYVEGNFEITNRYFATINVFGVYVSNEMNIGDKFKTILGLRGEQYNQNYTGQDIAYANGDIVNGRNFDDEEIINSFNLFPSVNLVYNLKDNQNLRVSYSRTIARPSFKEASIAQIFDPLSNTTFIGNIDLEETDIDNFDLRWETFADRGQTLAFSAFYKNFSNPIELVAFSDAAPDNFQPRNVGDAQVYGLEMEMRKNLSFISPALSNLSFNTNVSVIESALEMDKSPNGEFESRTNNLRDGEAIEDTRVMQGQSPYLINAGLSYEGLNNGVEAGLFYNVQGKTLTIVGIGPNPDVFQAPFHSVNFNLLKRFGPDQKGQLGLGISNLLGDKMERFAESFGSSDKLVYFRDPGTTFTLRFGYTF